MEQLDLFSEDDGYTQPQSFFDKKHTEQNLLIEDLKQRLKYKADIFYTPTEIQVLLGISYYRVFYLVKFFRIDAVKIHSCLRVPAASLIEYIENYIRITELERAYYHWIHSREAKNGTPA